MSAPALASLAAELRGEGTVISAHVVDPDDRERPALGLLAASGPATRGRAADYEELVECVREGYLLHYRRPRLLAPPDADLALLAGDYMYAKGLERLAALGDLASLRELSDLISLSAQLHAADRPARPEAVDALWLASAVAIATGPSDGHEAGKRALIEGGDSGRLYREAADVAARAGLVEQLATAAETVGFRAPASG